jgi:hypothetical protein
MIRSLAALFARKTAIVAITGVTVIGGATLALAVEGDPSPDEPVVASVDCNEQDNAEHEDCQDPAEPTDCTDEANAEHDDCRTPAEPTDCDDPANADHDDCLAPAEECETLDPDGVTCLDDDQDEIEECETVDADGVTCLDDEGDEGDEGDLDGEVTEETRDETVAGHPDNHGKYVSEAAKGGGPCADLEAGGYKNKGQCVADVARSDVGKKSADEPAAEPAPATETVIEQPAPVEEPAAAVVTEEPATGKPAHAGPPAGKGKGGKG